MNKISSHNPEKNLEENVIDFEEVFGPYRGKKLFLAVKRDYSEVIATGSGPLEALNNSKEAGYSRPILMKAPSENYCSIPTNFLPKGAIKINRDYSSESN